MEITVEMLFRLNESVEIILANQNGEEIGHYDGKDSIDAKYNDENIIYWKPIAENVIYIEIYQEEA